MTLRTKPSVGTYGTRPESCMSGTRREVAVHHSCVVPGSISTFPSLRRPSLPRGEVETNKFNGHLLIVQEIRALEDNTERSLADFLPHPVMNTHHVGRRRRHCGNERESVRQGWLEDKAILSKSRLHRVCIHMNGVGQREK